MYGVATYNEIVYNALVIVSVSPSLRHYLLEVRQTDGTLLHILPLVRDIDLTGSVNQSPELSFLMVFDLTIAADLERPNEVWLRRADGEVIEKFRIVLRSDTHANN